MFLCQPVSLHAHLFVCLRHDNVAKIRLRGRLMDVSGVNLVGRAGECLSARRLALASRHPIVSERASEQSASILS